MERSKDHFRSCLLMLFDWRKTVAEAHRTLVDIYGSEAPSRTCCKEWFQRFRSGDFDVKDKPRPGQRKKFENEDLHILLDEDDTRTEEQFERYPSNHFQTLTRNG